MSAGVHHADFLAVVRRAHRRFERQVHLFGHGERVHVGAQTDDTSRIAAAKNSDDTGVRDRSAHLDAELFELVGNEFRCAELAIAEFRMLMDVAPALDHRRLDFLRRLIDALIERCADRDCHDDHRFGIAPRSASAFSINSPNHSAKCGSFFSSASRFVRVDISMN